MGFFNYMDSLSRAAWWQGRGDGVCRSPVMQGDGPACLGAGQRWWHRGQAWPGALLGWIALREQGLVGYAWRTSFLFL